ncbi:MAG: hypothetical protein JWN31_1779 [Frankiales bacterium]|nr:hypothetical protein [Frankiales bacterium]
MKDSGSIVLGWLTKLVISLAVLGLIVFDGIALLTATLSAADHATNAAGVAADTYKASHNVQLAYNAAETEAAKNAETVETKSFRVSDNGHVTLTIDKTATTLWMHRIGFLRKYTMVTGTGEGAPPS